MSNQLHVTDDIWERFADYLITHLKDSAYGHFLKDFFVEFDEAAASSLNFFVWAAFSGEAAESYGRIRRLLQRLAVDACNANAWVIPFNQVTVHLAHNENISSENSMPNEFVDGRT